MPSFFGIKFITKKTPARKLNQNADTEELFGEHGSVILKLGGQETTFDNGEWIPNNGTTATLHRNTQKLKSRLHHLQEENNLLRLKYDMLINMMTQTTAENRLQKMEIEKLKFNQRRN